MPLESISFFAEAFRPHSIILYDETTLDYTLVSVIFVPAGYQLNLSPGTVDCPGSTCDIEFTENAAQTSDWSIVTTVLKNYPAPSDVEPHLYNLFHIKVKYPDLSQPGKMLSKKGKVRLADAEIGGDTIPGISQKGGKKTQNRKEKAELSV